MFDQTADDDRPATGELKPTCGWARDDVDPARLLQMWGYSRR